MPLWKWRMFIHRKPKAAIFHRETIAGNICVADYMKTICTRLWCISDVLVGITAWVQNLFSVFLLPENLMSVAHYNCLYPWYIISSASLHKYLWDLPKSIYFLWNPACCFNNYHWQTSAEIYLNGENSHKYKVT